MLTKSITNLFPHSPYASIRNTYSKGAWGRIKEHFLKKEKFSAIRKKRPLSLPKYEFSEAETRCMQYYWPMRKRGETDGKSPPLH